RSTSGTFASCDPWPAARHSGSYRLMHELLALEPRSIPGSNPGAPIEGLKLECAAVVTARRVARITWMGRCGALDSD
ncbi:MAG TPA: hypothetical protein VE127_13400, partial [Solirubrobacteraceae bacterium]|nr:hypothetical protein [Solirubrobacteraceae bacterium]